MAARAAELLTVTLLAAVVTVAISFPVLRSPSTRVFGMEIVGRHHDPFTVMQQYARASDVGVYWQPVTDMPGRLLAKLAGGPAAYNWLVLLSFPMAAATAFLLARYLRLSTPAAALAALAYAFSPFHLAQAAYHVHIAQVEWMPLYFLALWWSLDRPGVAALALLLVATAAVVLSNFYGGLIAIALTPVAVAASVLTDRGRGRWRRLGVTAAALCGIALAGLAYLVFFAPAVIADRSAFAFPPGDVARYSASLWGFVVPPIANPFAGPAVARFWASHGIRESLLEQQVSIGWSVIGLAAVAIGARWRGRHESELVLPQRIVPALAIVGVAALGLATVPPAWLTDTLPMFRSYARFGVAVQLMAALLAGIGFDRLRAGARRWPRRAAAVLTLLLVGEYVVAPRAMSRDVLPTAAHRWVMTQPQRVLALDCVAFTQPMSSIQWLSDQRIVVAGDTIDCLEPGLADALAANGYTHVISRKDPVTRASDAARWSTTGLLETATFSDSQVFAVAEEPPDVYTVSMEGFSPRERDPSWSWRWMSTDAAWSIRSTRAEPVTVTLVLTLSAFTGGRGAFHGLRRLDVRLDSRSIAALDVAEPRSEYRIGPFVVAPGTHRMEFHSLDAPTVADEVIHNGDRRALSFAVGTWRWISQGSER